MTQFERRPACAAATDFHGKTWRCILRHHTDEVEHIADLLAAGDGRSTGTLTWSDKPTPEDALLASWYEADGSRAALPPELAHLQPRDARAYWRHLFGVAPESAAESALAATILAVRYSISA